MDEGQLAAVKLILESKDMVIAIPGRTGAGKSRTVAEAAHAIRSQHFQALEPLRKRRGSKLDKPLG